MNFRILIVVLLMTALQAQSQNLFSYGAKQVSKQEFLRAFGKNPPATNRRQALEEYLPLYINYKLKVQDAYDKKMDTLPTQQAELEAYRQQLEENYLNELAGIDKLVQTAYERSQVDVLLADLYIAYPAGNDAEKEKALVKAREALQALKSGRPFEEVLKQYGTDAGAKNTGGLVGWVTVFSLPYRYENAIFPLAKGAVSEVAEAPSGYHIFKKLNERPARGRVQVQQILLSDIDKSNTAANLRNQQLADSLYNLLLAGASFDQLAFDYSNDRSSYTMGGMLPEFGVGAYETAFEDAAFALDSAHPLSKPFRTSFGWHILKLKAKKPIVTDPNDAENLAALKQQVQTGSYAREARNEMLKAKMPAMGFKQLPVDQKQLRAYTDSALKAYNTSAMPVNDKTPLLAFAKKQYTGKDWIEYLRQSNTMSPSLAGPAFTTQWNNFVLHQANEYYKQFLLQNEPEFNSQLKEFKDANLLFEAMDRQVWSKAADDEAGLKKHYAAHKATYKWDESADALLVTTTDKALSDSLRGVLTANPRSWRLVSEKLQDRAAIDSGRFELAQLPLANGEKPVAGKATAPLTNAFDNTITFACIVALRPPGEQRSFEEARGYVTNDYQQVLEQQWISRLKAKYPVKVNQTVWQQVLASR
jgi:peptidyl-prolyl cis-trans isomerase SurA